MSSLQEYGLKNPQGHDFDCSHLGVLRLLSQEIKAQAIDLIHCRDLPGSGTRTGNIYPGGHGGLEGKLRPHNGRRTEYSFAHSFKKYIQITSSSFSCPLPNMGREELRVIKMCQPSTSHCNYYFRAGRTVPVLCAGKQISHGASI